MDIQIPFNNYQLNIKGLDVYIDDTDTSYTAVTKQGVSVTSEITSVSISDIGNTTTMFSGYAGETISFGIYFEGNGDTPILSGSMSSFQLSGMPVDMYAFDGITSKKETTKFNWDGISLPSNAIWIKIYDGMSFHNTAITLPNLSVSDITYNSAVITVSDLSTFQALVLFKETGNDERMKLIDEAPTTNIISLTDLEMGTDYVVWLDGLDGLSNVLRFSTLGAPVWVKTDNGYKKGKLWVKTSSGWEKAKGIYCRKSTTDSWKKGV